MHPQCRDAPTLAQGTEKSENKPLTHTTERLAMSVAFAKKCRDYILNIPTPRPAKRGTVGELDSIAYDAAVHAVAIRGLRAFCQNPEQEEFALIMLKNILPLGTKHAQGILDHYKKRSAEEVVDVLGHLIEISK
jgi:hypothetical protein